MVVKKIFGLIVAFIVVVISTEFIINVPVSADDSVIVLNEPVNELSVNTAEQKEYLKGDCFLINEYADGTKENSRPATVELSWECGVIVDKYTVHIAENSALHNAVQYVCRNKSISITNLKAGAEYYWKVTAQNSSEKFESSIKKFVTEKSEIRNLYIDGVTNVRDLGGYIGLDGHNILQGMIFRTGNIDYVTSAGKNVLLNELKVKAEIDLRLTTEPSGAKQKLAELKYYNIETEINDPNQFLTQYSEDGSIKRIFEIMASEDNYPLLFHCAIGTDRTGAISFLLNGLLGASVEHIYKDYLFSNFGKIDSSRNRSAIDEYLSIVNRQAGNTLSEKVYYFLKNEAKVNDSTLDAVIDLLTDKNPVWLKAENGNATVHFDKEKGELIIKNIIPLDGYVLSSLIVEGISVPINERENKEYNFDASIFSKQILRISILINFIKESAKLTIDNDTSKGTVKKSLAALIQPVGTVLDFFVTPKGEYEIETIKFNETTLYADGNGKYTLIYVSGENILSITYKEKKYESDNKWVSKERKEGCRSYIHTQSLWFFFSVFVFIYYKK